MHMIWFNINFNSNNIYLMLFFNKIYFVMHKIDLHFTTKNIYLMLFFVKIQIILKYK